MITVEEADAICHQHLFDAGIETLALKETGTRILAQQILADRAFPPFDRSAMDGIAINFDAFANGERVFTITAVQAAGQMPAEIALPGDCIEIMTGAVVPSSAGTVVPYESIVVVNGRATITNESITRGQHVQHKGKDAKAGTVLVQANQWITPAIVNVAASVGATDLLVRKKPKIAILSTGDELVGINQIPTDFQLRRSNGEMISAILRQYGINAELTHVPDDLHMITTELQSLLTNFDVLLVSGGVSMGKFDFLPEGFRQLGVKQLFHKVKQKPGKPFWFGCSPGKTIVFGFPGNPVSTFTCMHRYFIPWLMASWQVTIKPAYAVLDRDVVFKPPLQHFMQVVLSLDHQGKMMASPVENNGSGDLTSLVISSALMELPAADEQFLKGTVYRIWPFDRPAFLY